jgi:predicted helicase
MSQSLKEWSDQTEQPMHAYAVCSDNKVGRVKDTDLTDVALHDLQIPATTDGARLIEAMNTRSLDEGMTVVFSTYQSIDAVRAAQQAGLPEFDLIICDEAHRTTGATLAGDGESHFVKIHDNHWISGSKRVYMTATPRIFNDNTKDAAREKDAVLCSMDDQSIYGPVFYRIGFGEAVEQKLLTDYKVLVLGVDETQVRTTFQDQLADSNSELPSWWASGTVWPNGGPVSSRTASARIGSPCAGRWRSTAPSRPPKLSRQSSRNSHACTSLT